MNIRLLLLPGLLAACCAPATAQNGNMYLEDSSIKMIQYGGQRALAWSGGFNCPQFAAADLNRDGLKDLVVYEGRERFVRTFLNKGTSTAAKYIYAPHFALVFPKCYEYLKLEDYNRDGIADLVHRGTQGFAVYKGYYDAQNELHFTFYKELRYDSPTFGNINAYTQASDIPGVIDVDGDGDLDFFGYDVNGGLISFYKNCQVEHHLPNDSIEVCNPTYCWGHTLQLADRAYVLGIVPALNSPTCPTNGTFGCKMVNGEKVVKETLHGGNCMLLLDYEGDGDVDMLDGNLFYSDIQLLVNGRAQYGGTDSMVAQDTLWQRSGHQLYMPTQPAAFYVDGDGDGKKDILIAPHAAGASENYKCIAMYRNTGTTAAPVFAYQSDSFLVDRSLDFGTASYPALYDYNRDGRLDLFVGSEGYYQPGGIYRSRIAYYQNSLAGGVTSLTLQNSDFGGISAQAFAGTAPAFGDIDGDGKDDLLLGHTDGTISYYKNTAVSNLVQPQWVLSQLKLKSTAGDTIDVGYNATPYVYDINKDGKPDLLIGNNSGRIVYYQGSSSGGVAALTLVTDALGGFKADTANTFTGYSSIWIGKIDVTNKEYILSGNGLGNIVRYTGFQNGNTTTPYRQLDSAYAGIMAGARSAVTAGDINGDGKPEMVIGSAFGGLYLYSQGGLVNVPGQAPAAGLCRIYPNPARNQLGIDWPAHFAPAGGEVKISLFNTLGQLVRTKAVPGAATHAELPVDDLPSGMYACQLGGGGMPAVLKVYVMK